MGRAAHTSRVSLEEISSQSVLYQSSHCACRHWLQFWGCEAGCMAEKCTDKFASLKGTFRASSRPRTDGKMLTVHLSVVWSGLPRFLSHILSLRYSDNLLMAAIEIVTKGRATSLSSRTRAMRRYCCVKSKVWIGFACVLAADHVCAACRQHSSVYIRGILNLRMRR